eukprot:6999711-Alexandrium_andersonii.AAC.1
MDSGFASARTHTVGQSSRTQARRRLIFACSGTPPAGCAGWRPCDLVGVRRLRLCDCGRGAHPCDIRRGAAPVRPRSGSAI